MDGRQVVECCSGRPQEGLGEGLLTAVPAGSPLALCAGVGTSATARARATLTPLKEYLPHAPPQVSSARVPAHGRLLRSAHGPVGSRVRAGARAAAGRRIWQCDVAKRTFERSCLRAHRALARGPPPADVSCLRCSRCSRSSLAPTRRTRSTASTRSAARPTRRRSRTFGGRAPVQAQMATPRVTPLASTFPCTSAQPLASGGWRRSSRPTAWTSFTPCRPTTLVRVPCLVVGWRGSSSAQWQACGRALDATALSMCPGQCLPAAHIRLAHAHTPTSHPPPHPHARADERMSARDALRHPWFAEQRAEERQQAEERRARRAAAAAAAAEVELVAAAQAQAAQAHARAQGGASSCTPTPPPLTPREAPPAAALGALVAPDAGRYAIATTTAPLAQTLGGLGLGARGAAASSAALLALRPPLQLRGREGGCSSGDGSGGRGDAALDASAGRAGAGAVGGVSGASRGGLLLSMAGDAVAPGAQRAPLLAQAAAPALTTTGAPSWDPARAVPVAARRRSSITLAAGLQQPPAHGTQLQLAPIATTTVHVAAPKLWPVNLAASPSQPPARPPVEDGSISIAIATAHTTALVPGTRQTVGALGAPQLPLGPSHARQRSGDVAIDFAALSLVDGNADSARAQEGAAGRAMAGLRGSGSGAAGGAAADAGVQHGRHMPPGAPPAWAAAQGPMWAAPPAAAQGPTWAAPPAGPMPSMARQLPARAQPQPQASALVDRYPPAPPQQQQPLYPRKLDGGIAAPALGVRGSEGLGVMLPVGQHGIASGLATTSGRAGGEQRRVRSDAGGNEGIGDGAGAVAAPSAQGRAMLPLSEGLRARSLAASLRRRVGGATLGAAGAADAPAQEGGAVRASWPPASLEAADSAPPWEPSPRALSLLPPAHSLRLSLAPPPGQCSAQQGGQQQQQQAGRAAAAAAASQLPAARGRADPWPPAPPPSAQDVVAVSVAAGAGSQLPRSWAPEARPFQLQRQPPPAGFAARSGQQPAHALPSSYYQLGVGGHGAGAARVPDAGGGSHAHHAVAVAPAMPPLSTLDGSSRGGPLVLATRGLALSSAAATAAAGSLAAFKAANAARQHHALALAASAGRGSASAQAAQQLAAPPALSSNEGGHPGHAPAQQLQGPGQGRHSLAAPPAGGGGRSGGGAGGAAAGAAAGPPGRPPLQRATNALYLPARGSGGGGGGGGGGAPQGPLAASATWRPLQALSQAPRAPAARSRSLGLSSNAVARAAGGGGGAWH